MNNIIYYALFDTAVNKWLIKNRLIEIKNGKNIGLIVQSGCDYFSSFQYPENIAFMHSIKNLQNVSIYPKICS